MANTDLDGAEPDNATGIDAAGVGANKVLDEVFVHCYHTSQLPGLMSRLTAMFNSSSGLINIPANQSGLIETPAISLSPEQYRFMTTPVPYLGVSPAMLHGIYGSGKDAVVGITTFVRHPVRSIKGILSLNPFTDEGLSKMTWLNVNTYGRLFYGDPYTQQYIGGHMIGDVSMTILGSGIASELRVGSLSGMGQVSGINSGRWSSFAIKNPVRIWGGVGEEFTENTGKMMGKSINQLNKAVKAGQAPKGIIRFDKGRGTKNLPQDEVHFKDGSSLYRDGTWRHNKGHQLTNEQINFLRENGWNIPK